MKTVLDLGKIDYNRSGRKNCRVTIEITLENGELSMVGHIWNPRETDTYCGGQCYDTIAEYFPHNKRVRHLVEIWKRWHLNDMRAGDQAQEDYLRAHKEEYKGHDWFDWATNALTLAGLNPHNCYTYGHAWLKEELPPEIVSEIKSLITTEAK